MKLKKLIAAAMLSLTLGAHVALAQYAYYPTPGCIDGYCGEYYTGWYYASWLGIAYVLFGNPYCTWVSWMTPDGLHGGYSNTCTGELYQY